MSSKRVAVALVLGASLSVSAQLWAQPVPLQYYPLTPCRLVDTRNLAQSPGGFGPAMKPKEIRPFPVQGNCGVPVGAKAVTINVTVAKPATLAMPTGYLKVYPTGDAEPLVSTINWPAGTAALANGAIVPLADQSLFPKDLTVKAAIAVSKVEVILDVTGYFE